MWLHYVSRSPPFIKTLITFSYKCFYYSQRSHLARIKGRVDKEVMPFSRSCLAVQITMADPQVPAEAVQQAQVVLQNQVQEAHAPAALAEQGQAPAAPVEQAQAPTQPRGQAAEVSLEVSGTLFYPFLATCFVLVL